MNSRSDFLKTAGFGIGGVILIPRGLSAALFTPPPSALKAGSIHPTILTALEAKLRKRLPHTNIHVRDIGFPVRTSTGHLPKLYNIYADRRVYKVLPRCDQYYGPKRALGVRSLDDCGGGGGNGGDSSGFSAFYDGGGNSALYNPGGGLDSQTAFDNAGNWQSTYSNGVTVNGTQQALVQGADGNWYDPNSQSEIPISVNYDPATGNVLQVIGTSKAIMTPVAPAPGNVSQVTSTVWVDQGGNVNYDANGYGAAWNSLTPAKDVKCTGYQVASIVGVGFAMVFGGWAARSAVAAADLAYAGLPQGYAMGAGGTMLGIMGGSQTVDWFRAHAPAGCVF